MTLRGFISALVGFGLVVAPLAHAHGPVDTHVRVIADGVEPAAAEVRVIAAYDLPGLPPVMTLRNDGSSEVEVLAPRGEPLFRIGAAGVFGNIRSPAYREATDPRAALPAPQAKPGSAVDWRQLSAEPSFRWYEDRAGFHGAIPTTVAGRRRNLELARWVVPILIGGRAATIRGRVIWRPILGDIRVRIVGKPFSDNRVDVTVLPGRVPGIQVKNNSQSLIEITGRDDQPFARVGPDGVEVNLESATYADTRGLAESSGGTARWKHQQDIPVLVWLERRAAYEPADPPESVEQRGKETVLLRWEIPARLDGRRVLIKGETYWAPFARAGTSSRLPVVAGVVAALALIGAFAITRARLRRAGAA